ncbi:hypothetical protein GRF29_185g163083 [Pseudopithomyces chartarum]|uniref:PH domain-containing protein n=1 Tax=Pseudopithomyces chartarum TaxID=1892770 RepID=A0AAN6LMV0_9PLEO|nr:hypothetical protein GRF29_185g163083 [Pseudopithomyces chartarum]
MAPNNTFSTSRWRRNRSNANLLDQNLEPVPAPAMAKSLRPEPTLERKSSRMSLFNLFSRPKVEKARGHTEVGVAIPMQPQEPPRPPSPPKSSLRQNPPPPVQQVHRARSSQFLRPNSMRPPSVKRPPGDDWDPPPLFQAYPQSIKYATVQACVYSPDALLRTQSQKKQADSLRERMDSHRDLSATLEGAAEPRKLEKSHKRLDSILNTTPQLTNKIYILVTSGHVLQYAGDGPFDRLPEKVLRLGKDSAAFASDLIPGKHWVLQILQSANEDGTVSETPKHSLLTRLRHGGLARRDAASFLLVMESAEEMESWMTIVRREIDNLGGMKASIDSIRESSSIDESSERASGERSFQRQPPKRESSRLSMLRPIDSPLQSQYSDSPKIVASDWESVNKDKPLPAIDPASTQSPRPSMHRQSVEAPSIANSTSSQEQAHLDQIRDRSRFSFVSTAATSVSGAGTRNPSRDASPAPTSPISEVTPPADVEPRRSETSLRSFHMHPGNSSTRRRSMQPLPVTNEDISVSAQSARTRKRHSIYGPTSPTASEPRRLESKLESGTPISSLTSYTPAPRSTSSDRARMSAARTSADAPRNTSPPRTTTRSSSAPPTRITTTMAPPPLAPLPEPPTSRPQSTMLGSLSTAAAALPSPSHRISPTPKPFLRPLPVRPQPQANGSITIAPRRGSLAPANKPARLPLSVVINRSVTEPPRAPPTASPSSRQPSPARNFSSSPQGQAQPLRRPTNVQIRSDPAPFLSTRAPRAVSSTPSFIAGPRGLSGSSSRATSPAPPAPPAVAVTPAPALAKSPSIPVLRGHGQQLVVKKEVAARKSMPALAVQGGVGVGLPPMKPPPTMPLPATPMGVGRGVVV